MLQSNPIHGDIKENRIQRMPKDPRSPASISFRCSRALRHLNNSVNTTNTDSEEEEGNGLVDDVAGDALRRQAVTAAKQEEPKCMVGWKAWEERRTSECLHKTGN